VPLPVAVKIDRYSCRELVLVDDLYPYPFRYDALRSQTDKRQATEVAIAVDILNRMLELGRPIYVRIA
jgi:hypothetical protein